MKKYEITVYYSGFCTYEVEATDAQHAVETARNLPLDEQEILSNLEGWSDVDCADKI